MIPIQNKINLQTVGFRIFQCAAVFSGMLLASSTGLGQGCIAIRGGSLCPLGGEAGHAMIHGQDMPNAPADDWQLTLGYRTIYSDRHFRGDHEEKRRQAQNTEVINDSHFFDLSLFYNINSHWSAGLTVPFVYSERSSLYEHPGSGRNTTTAGGLGDIRLSAYYWLIDTSTMPKANVLFGLGPKFPTGDHNAKDTFYNATTGPVKNAVDQSIQPGDGGFGFTAELFGYAVLFPRMTAYMQGFYLFNPETDNGTSTTTGRPRSNPFEGIMSITDQYLGRAGFSYVVMPQWGLSLSLGGRIEGIPVEDALGSSGGFRRPGYAVSIEPGISLIKNSWSFNVTVPVALYRNREQSVTDKLYTQASGVYRHGDAAFSDYSITANISKSF